MLSARSSASDIGHNRSVFTLTRRILYTGLVCVRIMRIHVYVVQVDHMSEEYVKLTITKAQEIFKKFTFPNNLLILIASR